jgi:hypothetical protein
MQAVRRIPVAKLKATAVPAAQCASKAMKKLDFLWTRRGARQALPRCSVQNGAPKRGGRTKTVRAGGAPPGPRGQRQPDSGD